ncbi:hypothetical protein [Arachidicoccus soli]|nr:hypothetical protein [Arachidicoccus soli]
MMKIKIKFLLIAFIFQIASSFNQINAQTLSLKVSFDTLIVKMKVPDSLHLDPFYQKYADAFGIPIVSSSKVPDAALLVAKDIVNYMLSGRPDIRREMVKEGARVMVEAQSEMETDLPEHRNWKKPTKDDPRLVPEEREDYDKPGGIGSMTDRQYWNQRARGMGGLHTSCAEENLLGYPGTRYYGENIFVHEFSHNILGTIERLNKAFYDSVDAAYHRAKQTGKYKGQYALTTVQEYWAEGTQWWFWSNIEFYDKGIRIQSPSDLKNYDPDLYNLLAKVYIGHHIPADVYYSRNLRPARRR